MLLVEDDPRARDAIAEALDGAGLGVAGAASAEAALRVAEADPGLPPAVLVTDPTSPRRAAWTGSRWPPRRGGDGPAWAWSSSPAARPGSTGMCSARDRFLPKPGRRAALVRAVRGLVGASPRRAP